MPRPRLEKKSMKSSLSARPSTSGPMTIPSISSATTTGGAHGFGTTTTITAAGRRYRVIPPIPSGSAGGITSLATAVPDTKEGESMSEIGPVQLVAVGFPPGAKFEGRIMAELARLEQSGTIRILDLLFVHKDAESGDLVALDYQGEELGAIVGALLGFEFEGDEGAATADASPESHAFGLSQEQITGMAEGLEPGQAA